MAVSTEGILFPISLLRIDGGINTRFSAVSLEENEVADMENFHLEGRGGGQKRKGYDELFDGDSDTTFPINGLYYFKPTDEVLRIQNGALHSNDGGGWTARTGSLTLEDDPDVLYNWTTFKKYALGTNGVDRPFKYDGTGDAVVASNTLAGGDTLDKAAVCVRHRERIILADVTATISSVQTRYESRLWASEVGTLDTWETDLIGGKIIDVDEGDGDSITALVDVQGYLVIFKQNSLHRINDFGLAGVSSTIKVGNVGTPGPHSICVVGNMVFFLDAIGQLWVYDARGTNEDNVVNLSERKLGKDTLDLINKVRLDKSHLWFDAVRNEIRAWITTFGSDETDLAWTFNLTTGGFGKLRYTEPMSISAKYVDPALEQRCIVGTYTGGVMLLDEGVDDNGTTYEAFYITRQLDFGDNAVIKGTRMMHIYGSVLNDTDMTIEHRVNLQAVGLNYSFTLEGPGAKLDEFVLDEDVLGGSGDSMSKVRVESYARWHQFKLSQEVDEDLRLTGLVLLVVTSGRDRDGS